MIDKVLSLEESPFEINFKKIDNNPLSTKHSFQVINYTKNIVGYIRYNYSFREYLFESNGLSCLYDTISLNKIITFIKKITKEDLNNE